MVDPRLCAMQHAVVTENSTMVGQGKFYNVLPYILPVAPAKRQYQMKL